jgi:hypothetical protein
MKKQLVKVAIIVCLFSIFGIVGENAYSEIITNVPPDISAEEIRAIVVEDFESGKLWTIKSEPKQFNGPGTKKRRNPVPILEAKVIDGAPSDLVVEQWTANKRGMQKTKCLGVHFKFRYPGHNSVHLIPPEPIRSPGRTQGLSLWVHGRGKAYALEAWVKDYKGNTHIIKFGTVNFVGWKPLKAYIPPFVPQEIESYPQTKTIVIERFVLRADPSEDTEEVFFFFDQIKVLSETFEVNFDGQGLEKAFEKSGSSKENSETTVTE